MSVWEYKIISSGKGGFATPALLESFLNQLGKDEWEIIEFRSQPDNALAFSGLARRSTQRDWTLEDAAAAAARAEADKLRAEFEAKFRGSGSGSESGPEAGTAAHDPAAAAGPEDGLRRLRDTEHDQDPNAPEEEAGEDEWDKLGADQEALPTFFEAIRPHMRRNQRGPGMSVGVDYLAKKWEFSEEDVLNALRECGFEVPEDEDADPVHLEYDGDLFWVNINRRGEIWINTKEKPRAVFRTIQAKRLEPAPEAAPAAVEPGSSEGAAPSEAPAAAPERAENRPGRQDRGPRERRDGREPAQAKPLPEGEALLDAIRPHMRRNRREPGGSGSIVFLARALRCGEPALEAALLGLGLSFPPAQGDRAPVLELGGAIWWLNRDGRGGAWINAREKREGETIEGGISSDPGTHTTGTDQGGHGPETTLEGSAQPADGSGQSPAAVPSGSAPAPEAGAVLTAVRLLLRETRTGGVAATVDRIAGELGRGVEELVAALVSAGLSIPDKPREKPVYVAHAGEIFWFNRNAKGELWVNAKASLYGDPDSSEEGASRGRRRSRRGPVSGPAEGEGAPGVEGQEPSGAESGGPADGSTASTPAPEGGSPAAEQAPASTDAPADSAAPAGEPVSGGEGLPAHPEGVAPPAPSL